MDVNGRLDLVTLGAADQDNLFVRGLAGQIGRFDALPFTGLKAIEVARHLQTLRRMILIHLGTVREMKSIFIGLIVGLLQQIRIPERTTRRPSNRQAENMPVDRSSVRPATVTKTGSEFDTGTSSISLSKKSFCTKWSILAARA